jgi:hypothetical protein
MVFCEPFPDAQYVGEQAQGHARVLRALVLKKQIKIRIALLELDAKKQVAL